MIKLSCVASWKKEYEFTGLAVLARDWRGKLIAGTAKKIRSASAKVAEAEALRMAVQFMLKNEWDEAVIETGNKDLVTSLTLKNREAGKQL